MRLSEHLDENPIREIIDEPETLLAVSLASRFRAQARRVRSALRVALEDHDPGHDGPSAAPMAVSSAIIGAFAGFRYVSTNRVFRRAADEVRAGAAEIAAAELALEQGVTIPGYQRTAQDLMTDIDLTTSKAVLDAVQDAYASGTVATLLDKVAEIFDSAVENRAASIASTEISTAYNQGADAVAKASGLAVQKLWNAEPDACEICMGNAEDGWIDNDEPFTSGDDYPPAHPNCRCSVDLRTAE